MNPSDLLLTAILMGLFVSTGGCWGLLYCLGQTRHSHVLQRAGQACYLLSLTLAISLSFFTPLEAKWKLLILASGIAYAFIPPITLRYLQRQHAEESEP